ncbi:hypothetical protein JNJ66_02770 [Candidatus Saccharibacteria bacterium]|nr:hypothetical protein [Candidatus Saccharibacteria bacterium]
MSTRFVRLKSAAFRLAGVYFIVSLLILGLILLPGYTMTLDMTWGPLRPLPEGPSNVLPFYWLIAQLQAVVPGWLVQKLILLGIFMLAGIGAHKLARLALEPQKGGAPVAWTEQLCYLAGFLFMINPFIYSRYAAGQWLVMLGYALLPWAIRAVWRLLQRLEWRRALAAAGWLLAICLTSIHTAGFLPLIMLVLLVASGRAQLGRKLAWLSGVAVGLLLINAFWLVPSLNGQGRLAQSVASFDSSQMKAFASVGTVLDSVPLSAALLSGFWADAHNRYVMPQATGVLWGVTALLVVGLVLLGARRIWQRRDRLGVALLALGVIAWWLAMGVAWEGSRPLAYWLADNVPFYAGYREPQKWLMVLAVTYAYCAALGGDAVLRYLKGRCRPAAKFSRVKSYAIGAMLLLPFVWTPMQLAGAARQLGSVQYPAGWQQAKDALAAHGAARDSTVVVLPWHMYMPMSFTQRTTGNPASAFFPHDMITSNNPELRGVPFDAGGPVESYINAEFLPAQGGVVYGAKPPAQRLNELGVEYIMLLKEGDWRRYEWLQTVPGLLQVTNNDDIIIYSVN